MAFFGWKKVNAQVLSVNACIKEWNKQQAGILKEFAAKETGVKADIAAVYNETSDAGKALLRDPTEESIKASPEEATRLISDLSGKGVPGFKFLDANVPKLGVVAVSKAVAAAFKPVAALLPPVESPPEVPETAAESSVAQTPVVEDLAAANSSLAEDLLVTAPTDASPAEDLLAAAPTDAPPEEDLLAAVSTDAPSATKGPESTEAESTPETTAEDVTQAKHTSTSALEVLAEKEQTSSSAVEEPAYAEQASASTLEEQTDLKEAVALKDTVVPGLQAVEPAKEDAVAVEEPVQEKWDGTSLPPLKDSSVTAAKDLVQEYLESAPTPQRKAVFERQASIHDDFVKLDSDTIAMFLQGHVEEEDGEGGTGSSGAAKIPSGIPAGATSRPGSKASTTTPSGTRGATESIPASPTPTQTSVEALFQPAESIPNTPAPDLQPKGQSEGAVEGLLSDASALTEEKEVTAVTGAPAALSEYLSVGKAVAALETAAKIPAAVVGGAKASLQAATDKVAAFVPAGTVASAEASSESAPVTATGSVQEKVDVAVSAVKHAELSLEEGAQSATEKATVVTEATDAPEVSSPAKAEDKCIETKADADVGEEIWADAEAVMRDEVDGESPVAAAGSPAKAEPVASPVKGASFEDAFIVNATKVGVDEAVASPLKVADKVAAYEAVFSPAKLASEKGPAVASPEKMASPVSPAKTASSEPVVMSPVKAAFIEPVGSPDKVASGSAVEAERELAVDEISAAAVQTGAKKPVSESKAELVAALSTPEVSEVLEKAAVTATEKSVAVKERAAEKDEKAAVLDAPVPVDTQDAVEEAVLVTASETAVEDEVPAAETSVEAEIPVVPSTGEDSLLHAASILTTATEKAVVGDDAPLPVVTETVVEDVPLLAAAKTATADVSLPGATEAGVVEMPPMSTESAAEDALVISAPSTPAESVAEDAPASVATTVEGEGDEKKTQDSQAGGGKVQNLIKKIFGKSRESSPRAEASPLAREVEKLGISAGLVSKGVAAMESLSSPPKEKDVSFQRSKSQDVVATVGTTTTAAPQDKEPLVSYASVEAVAPSAETLLSSAGRRSSQEELAPVATTAAEVKDKEVELPAAASSVLSPVASPIASTVASPTLPAYTAATATVPPLSSPTSAVEATVEAVEVSTEVSAPSDAASPVGEAVAIVTQFAGLAPEAGSEAAGVTGSVLPGGQGAVSTAADSTTTSTGTASSDVKGLAEAAVARIPAVVPPVTDTPVAVATSPKKEKPVTNSDGKGDVTSHVDAPESKIIDEKVKPEATPARNLKHKRSLSSTIFSRFIEKERAEPVSSEGGKDVENLTPIVPPKRRRNSSSLFGCFSKPKAIE